MVARNDITGDEIKSRCNSEQYKENLGKIEPQCFKDCKYLIDTLTKCRVCDWRDPALALKKDKK